MSPPVYQELAALADFLRLGIPPEALRTARTTQAPVTATGAGVGLVVPGGALDVGAMYVTDLPVLVEVVAGGAPGAATWRWSADAGVTWTATATTPGAGSTVALVAPGSGVPTGLTLRFAGVQTTGARYAWTASSAVGAVLRAANEEAFSYLGDRYNFPLTTVPTNVTRDVCVIAAADVMAVTGYAPDTQADKLYEARAAATRKRMMAERDSETGARVGESGTPRAAPRVSTGAQR